MSVSREHGRILCLAGRHFIEDLDSRNGTSVKCERLTTPGRTALRNNDRVRICGFVAAYLERGVVRPGEEDGGDEAEGADGPPSTAGAIATPKSLLDRL